MTSTKILSRHAPLSVQHAHKSSKFGQATFLGWCKENVKALFGSSLHLIRLASRQIMPCHAIWNKPASYRIQWDLPFCRFPYGSLKYHLKTYKSNKITVSCISLYPYSPKDHSCTGFPKRLKPTTSTPSIGNGLWLSCGWSPIEIYS